MVMKTMKPTGKSSPAGIFCCTRPKLPVLWVPSDDSSWGVLGLKPPGYPKVLSTESSTERAKNSRARQLRFFLKSTQCFLIRALYSTQQKKIWHPQIHGLMIIYLVKIAI